VMPKTRLLTAHPMTSRMPLLITAPMIFRVIPRIALIFQIALKHQMIARIKPASARFSS